MSQTFTINGKEFTVEQIAEIRRQAAEAGKVVKAAEKAGFIEKVKKGPKEKAVITPEVQALKDALEIVLNAHLDTIEGLFKATVNEDKPTGNIGVNLSLPGNFHVQLLNEATRKAKLPKKEEKPEETEETKTE